LQPCPVNNNNNQHIRCRHPISTKAKPKILEQQALGWPKKKSSIEECHTRSQNPYEAAFIRIKLSGSKLQEQDSSI
jgi:hypothetical protein